MIRSLKKNGKGIAFMLASAICVCFGQLLWKLSVDGVLRRNDYNEAYSEVEKTITIEFDDDYINTILDPVDEAALTSESSDESSEESAAQPESAAESSVESAAENS